MHPIRTKTWKTHPSFSLFTSGLANDIMLLDMRGTGFALSNNVIPVCKPTASPSLDDIVTVLGFGVTGSETTVEEFLMDRPLKKVGCIFFSPLNRLFRIGLLAQPSVFSTPSCFTDYDHGEMSG